MRHLCQMVWTKNWNVQSSAYFHQEITLGGEYAIVLVSWCPGVAGLYAVVHAMVASSLL
jgi:hypothetical protein